MAATYQLAISDVFDTLSAREKRYAHHLARAAWLGSRIVLRQTSPESEGIFDLILQLHKACNGRWSALVDDAKVEQKEVDAVLEFAAQFLAHLGNYYVSRLAVHWRVYRDEHNL
jgi:dipeptidyl-peptidase-3